ncbi:beta-1,3-glucan-binding protein-like [Euwallacea similis]|uniref:beta-1,3-glucan-binding protein-like n=1 Tax=Euwallacea similis TaxID=1736056 RepID=UPI0034500E10
MLLLVAVLAFSLACCVCSGDYTVPAPKIEIFDKGFRFSIPHEEGVQLFAFHGNINEPMNGLEAGHFSKDILKKCNDRWVFEDKTRKLVAGNIVYFWLFVIKDELGYRYDDGEYIVKDTSSVTPLNCTAAVNLDFLFNPERSNQHNPLLDVRSYRMNEPTSSNKSMERGRTRDSQVTACCGLFLNASYDLLYLAQANEYFETENRILYELAQKDDYHATVVKVFGRFPMKSTPKEFAQALVREKLRLSHINVVEARAIPDGGISFKVEKLRDKIEIIIVAKTKLEGSNYQIFW